MYYCPSCKENTVTYKASFTSGKPTVVYSCSTKDCMNWCICKYCYLENDMAGLDPNDIGKEWIVNYKSIDHLLLYHQHGEDTRFIRDLGDSWKIILSRKNYYLDFSLWKYEELDLGS